MMDTHSCWEREWSECEQYDGQPLLAFHFSPDNSHDRRWRGCTPKDCLVMQHNDNIMCSVRVHLTKRFTGCEREGCRQNV